MAAGYLYLNAALYLIFAVWCTVAPTTTATSLGYQALSAGGRSEYLVIYGGLQLGLSAIFAITARNPEANRLGVLLAVALYAPIVLFRVVTVIREWPVAPLTVGTGCLETVLLAAAIWLYRA